MKEIIPKHIKEGIAKAKKLTERQVYVMVREKYRTYVVEYKETIEYIRSRRQGGSFGGNFEGIYYTGVYSNNKFNPDKVAVFLADERTFIFSLKKIFEDLLGGNEKYNLALF